MKEKQFIEEMLSIEKELALLIEKMIADEVNPKLIIDAAHLHKKIYGAISTRVFDDVHIGGNDEEYREKTLKKLLDLQTFSVGV